MNIIEHFETGASTAAGAGVVSATAGRGAGGRRGSRRLQWHLIGAVRVATEASTVVLVRHGPAAFSPYL